MKSATNNLKIFRAALIVGSLTLLARVGSAGKDIVVAKWFGRAGVLDAFLIAFMVSSCAANIAADALSVGLIPTNIEVRETKGSEAARELLSSIFFLGLAVFLGLAILTGFLAPYYLRFIASGFNNSKLELTRHLLYLLLPYGLMNAVFIFWTATLNAFKDFVVPSWSPILVPVAVVAFLLVGGKAWGIYALTTGMVFGMLLQCMTVGLAIRAKGILVWPRWYGMSFPLRRVMTQSLVSVPVGVLVGGMSIVDQAMAAMLASGSIAALAYGLKVVSLVNSLGGTTLNTVVFPYFSTMVAQNDREGLLKTLNTYVLLCVWVGTAISSCLYLFSHPLIRLFFQRGAFTAADTILVSRISAFYSLEIPAFMMTVLAVRVLSSLNLNHVLAVVALMNFIVNIPMNFLLMKYFGVAGIALSTTTVFIFSTIVLFVILVRRAGIALERGTIVQIFYAGVVLLASVALSEWNRGGIAVNLVGWFLVLIISVWGLSRQFNYRDILPVLARIANP